MVRQIALWDTTRIRFGKFASLFAFVLFAGSCVVRISYESFLDFGFSEFFMFLEWRTAFISFRFQCVLINTSFKEGSLPSLTIHLAELSQLDRSCLRLVSCNLSESQTKNGLASFFCKPVFSTSYRAAFLLPIILPTIAATPNTARTIPATNPTRVQ